MSSSAARMGADRPLKVRVSRAYRYAARAVVVPSSPPSWVNPNTAHTSALHPGPDGLGAVWPLG
jgi:hypothetical protein